MSFNNVSSGEHCPKSFNVVIEIPQGGAPVKYEVDKDSGTLWVDRFMATAMYYPANYGYIPDTLSEDGDPVDVLVLTPQPLLPGSIITARPIGVLTMSDEKGPDAKLLAVPIDEITTLYSEVNSTADIPALTLKQIEHFFEHYKDLEPNKWVKIDGWADVATAEQEILASIERYKA